MIKLKLDRCQHQPARTVFSTVDRIAQNRPLALGQVGADLMLAARLQPYPHFGNMPVHPQNLVLGDGPLSSSGGFGRVNGAVGVFDKLRLDTAFDRLRRTVNQREVYALDGVPEELRLERFVRKLVLGKHEQSRRIAVQPMNQPGASIAIVFREVFLDNCQRGRARLTRSGAGQQPRRFVDDKKILILEDALERLEQIRRFDWPGTISDFQLIRLPHPFGQLPYPPAIESHPAGKDQALERRTAGIGET